MMSREFVTLQTDSPKHSGWYDFDALTILVSFAGMITTYGLYALVLSHSCGSISGLFVEVEVMGLSRRKVCSSGGDQEMIVSLKNLFTIAYRTTI